MICVGFDAGAFKVALITEIPPFSTILVSELVINVTVGLSLLNKFKVTASKAVAVLVSVGVNIMVCNTSISSSSNPLVLIEIAPD